MEKQTGQVTFGRMVKLVSSTPNCFRDLKLPGYDGSAEKHVDLQLTRRNSEVVFEQQDWHSKELPLTPDSSSFHLWRTTPVPIHIDFYFWNWTNPDMIEEKGVKPAFVQMGPYRFTETHEKVNITWNKNGTVSFRQIRRWWFDAENSAGSLLDNVTTINTVALTAAHLSRNSGIFYQASVSLALTSTGQTLAITKTAGEFLFDGYSDSLISIAANVPALSSIQIPFDKFGWFYERNGSSVADGLLNMFTGTLPEEGGENGEAVNGDVMADPGIGRLGVLDRWNGWKHTPYYDGDCGKVSGSAGELWPPGQHAVDHIALFSTDLCRTIRIAWTDDTMFESLPGRRFAGGARLLEDDDAKDNCSCNGECLPAGVLNVTACRYGAPAFVSLPHFLGADESYRQDIDGMAPDSDKHNIYIILEPTTGIPLDVAARFQINLLLQQRKQITMLSKVPKRVLLPVIWFEERVSITDELAVPLSLLLRVPLLLCVSGAVLAAIGFILTFSPAIFSLRRWQRRRGERAPTHATDHAVDDIKTCDTPKEKDDRSVSFPLLRSSSKLPSTTRRAADYVTSH